VKYALTAIIFITFYQTMAAGIRGDMAFMPLDSFSYVAVTRTSIVQADLII
jgi:hypothetical protein